MPRSRTRQSQQSNNKKAPNRNAKSQAADKGKKDELDPDDREADASCLESYLDNAGKTDATTREKRVRKKKTFDGFIVSGSSGTNSMSQCKVLPSESRGKHTQHSIADAVLLKGRSTTSEIPVKQSVSKPESDRSKSEINLKTRKSRKRSHSPDPPEYESNHHLPAEDVPNKTSAKTRAKRRKVEAVIDTNNGDGGDTKAVCVRADLDDAADGRKGKQEKSVSADGKRTPRKVSRTDPEEDLDANRGSNSKEDGHHEKRRQSGRVRKVNENEHEEPRKRGGSRNGPEEKSEVNERENDSVPDDNVEDECHVNPRQRGRPRELKPARRQIAANEHHQKHSVEAVEKSGDAQAQFVCQRCAKSYGQAVAIKSHMMSSHSLVWERENPLGVENATFIIRRLGYIDCQGCKKRFKNPQYYRHHQIWCGREDEMATCEICQKTMRAMWLQQHLTAHKTKEKQEEKEKERLLKESEMKKEEVKEEEGEASTNMRSKRQAAKSALNVLKKLQEPSQTSEPTSDEEFVVKDEEKSEEDQDDDEDDDLNEENDDDDNDDIEDNKTEEEKPARPSRMPSAQLGPSHKEMDVTYEQGLIFDPVERIKQLHKFYDSASHSDKQCFLEFRPKIKEWEPLLRSDCEKYFPQDLTSKHFSFNETEKSQTQPPGETTLAWGESMRVNGRHYCYTGGPTWAVEWCPLPDKTTHDQILAVSVDKHSVKLPEKNDLVEGPGSIQIWSMGKLNNSVNSCANPVLQYCIAHDSGYVRSMSWCPRLSFNENIESDEENKEYMARLGLLAVACSDGNVLVYSLPQPASLKQGRCAAVDEDVTVYQPPPSKRLVMNSSHASGPCLTVSWQPGEDMKYILAGFAKGAVCIWDLTTTSPMLIVDSTTVRPVRCFPPHTLAVTSCAWNPRNPDVFVTSSLDSTLCMWDVKKPYQPICSLKKYSSNFIPRSVFWAGPLYSGFFNTCERLAMSTKCPVYFHGPGTTSAILCQNDTACTWDVTFNPFYEALVTCNVVGTVMVTLTPLSSMFTTTGKSKGKRMRKKCHSAILYQVKIVKTRIPSPSPVATANSSQDDKAAAEGNASTPSTKETSRRKRKHSQSSSLPSATNDSHNNVNNSCKESLDSSSNIQLSCDVDCIDSVAATGHESASQLQQVTGYSVKNSSQGNIVCKSKVNEAVECVGFTSIQSDFTTTNGDLTNGSGDFTKEVGKHHKESAASRTKKKATDKDKICDRTTSNSGDDTVVFNSSVDPQKASECDGNMQTLSESPQNVSSPATASSNSIKGNSRRHQKSISHDLKSSSTFISQCNKTTSSVSPSKPTQGINKSIISVKNTVETNTTTSEIHPITSQDSNVSQTAVSASEEETEQSLRSAQSSVGDQDHSQSTSVETRSPSAKTTTVDERHAGAEGDSVVEPGTVESLYFQDCKLISKELILGYPPEQNKILEDFGGSNLNAVYRVRFNPNPDSSLWLASGGQSGLLRLDNLCGLVQPHRPQVLDFYKKRSKAKS